MPSLRTNSHVAIRASARALNGCRNGLRNKAMAFIVNKSTAGIEAIFSVSQTPSLQLQDLDVTWLDLQEPLRTERLVKGPSLVWREDAFS